MEGGDRYPHILLPGFPQVSNRNLVEIGLVSVRSGVGRWEVAINPVL